VSEELAGLSLAAAAAGIASRELSPVELTQAALDRIQALDPRLNAFITVSGESALAAARAAEGAIAAGYHLGPLHGIPLALKDLIATRGERTTGGSRILADHVPDEDATVTARLRRAGAIFVGKLNMHEFAYGVTTNNPHYGPARNPWNLDRSPGGSSGGSGAAVAARLCQGALGTDTGCSVRLPAAYNGISGLRPSIGRVSNHGVGTLAWTLDTVGPMCRTAEDCALVLGAIAGHDARDRQTLAAPVPDYRDELRHGLDGVRVAVIEDFSLAGLHPDVAGCAARALDDLRAGGAVVREVAMRDLEPSISALLTIDIAEPSAYHAEWLRTRAGEYGDDVRTLLEAGELYLATHYIQAQRYRTLLRDQLLGVLRDAEAIVTPTVPFTAPPVEAVEVELPTGETLDVIPAVMRYNALPPLGGLPALSLPCGFDGEGLPVGLQVIGRPFDEATVLRIGHRYQQETDWHARSPAL